MARKRTKEVLDSDDDTPIAQVAPLNTPENKQRRTPSTTSQKKNTNDARKKTPNPQNDEEEKRKTPKQVQLNDDDKSTYAQHNDDDGEKEKPKKKRKTEETQPQRSEASSSKDAPEVDVADSEGGEDNEDVEPGQEQQVTTSGKKKKKTKTKNRWTVEETNKLVDLYNDYRDNENCNLYDELSLQLNRPPLRCKNRLNALRKRKLRQDLKRVHRKEAEKRKEEGKPEPDYERDELGRPVDKDGKLIDLYDSEDDQLTDILDKLQLDVDSNGNQIIRNIESTDESPPAKKKRKQPSIAEDESDFTHAQKAIRKVQRDVDCSLNVAVHGLYICSGDVNLAIHYLKNEISREERKRVFSDIKRDKQIAKDFTVQDIDELDDIDEEYKQIFKERLLFLKGVQEDE